MYYLSKNRQELQMRFWIFRVLLPATCGFVVAWCFVPQHMKDNNQDSQSLVSFTSKECDLGRIEPDSQYRCAFSFRNISDSVIVVTEIKPSCGCIVSEQEGISIAPHVESTINADFSTRGINPPAKIRKTVAISFQSHDKITIVQNVELGVLGDVQPDIAITPPGLHFTTDEGSEVRDVTIERQGVQDEVLNSVDVAFPACFSANEKARTQSKLVYSIKLLPEPLCTIINPIQVSYKKRGVDYKLEIPIKIDSEVTVDPPNYFAIIEKTLDRGKMQSDSRKLFSLVTKNKRKVNIKKVSSSSPFVSCDYSQLTNSFSVQFQNLPSQHYYSTFVCVVYTDHKNESTVHRLTLPVHLLVRQP